MQIEDQKVVQFNYVLTDDEGQIMDQSDGQPLAYIHGSGNIIPGLETALAGKSAGDSVEVHIEPADAYGERSLEAIQTVQRSAFQGIDDIQPGMQFQAQGPEGGAQLVTVTAVDADSVTIDTNHPLAGKALNFSVDIVEVRDAQPEELEHGHVHGPDGHQH